MNDQKQSNLFGDTVANTVVKTREDKRNPEVQLVIDTLMSTLNLKMLDGTHHDNRIFAYNLIRKFTLPTTLQLITATKQNHWWSGRVTSTRKLYYNAVAIMSDATGRSNGGRKVSIDTTDF